MNKYKALYSNDQNSIQEEEKSGSKRPAFELRFPVQKALKLSDQAQLEKDLL